MYFSHAIRVFDFVFFFSSRRRHTRFDCDWSSDVCSSDLDKAKGKKTKPSRARVNWDSLERRISESEAAYQRPVIRRKIDELVAYYRECKDAGTLPPIPGAVIITSEKRFTFTPVGGHHDIGLLQIPEEHGVLRVLDGQHRLLALHALSQAGEQLGLDVPAGFLQPLGPAQTVETVVHINSQHTTPEPTPLTR